MSSYERYVNDSYWFSIYRGAFGLWFWHRIDDPYELAGAWIIPRISRAGAERACLRYAKKLGGPWPHSFGPPKGAFEVRVEEIYNYTNGNTLEYVNQYD